MCAKLVGFVVLILSVCMLPKASAFLYDDFSSGNLDKWYTDPSWSVPASVVNEQLYFYEDVSYAFEFESTIFTRDVIQPNFSKVTADNPLEMSVTISNMNLNPYMAGYNYLRIGFSAMGSIKMGLKFGFDSWANNQTISIFYTDNSGYLVTSDTLTNVAYFDGDVIGIRVTDTQIMVLQNGLVYETFSAVYGGSSYNLEGFIRFSGPNVGGSVTIDDVNFIVPEPVTGAVLTAGCVLVMLRRRKQARS